MQDNLLYLVLTSTWVIWSQVALNTDMNTPNYALRRHLRSSQSDHIGCGLSSIWAYVLCQNVHECALTKLISFLKFSKCYQWSSFFLCVKTMVSTCRSDVHVYLHVEQGIEIQNKWPLETPFESLKWQMWNDVWCTRCLLVVGWPRTGVNTRSEQALVCVTAAFMGLGAWNTICFNKSLT